MNNIYTINKLSKLFYVSILIILFCFFSIIFFDKSLTLLCYENRTLQLCQFFDYIKDGLPIPFLTIYIAGLLLAIVMKHKKISYDFLFLLLCNILCQFTINYSKYIFGRTRPFRWLESKEYSFSFFKGNDCHDLQAQSYAFDFFDGKYCNDSFPSGHSGSVFCLAFSLGLLFPFLRLPLLLYAILVSTARVLLTIHYLSDVIMGAYIAFFVVYLLYFLRNYLNTKRI